VWWAYVVLIYVRLGEKAPAFECAQKAYQEHSGLLACLNVAPRVGDALPGAMRRVGLRS